MSEPTRKLKCFLSYRRKDLIVAGAIGRIYDRLEARLGRGHVFMDVDSIPPGADFRSVIEEEVSRADVLLVLIGTLWPQIMRERGVDPNDFVRIEIESAIARGIPVVPVLIGEARMPLATDLPESLNQLPFINAAEIDPGKHFNGHIKRLIDDLETHYQQVVEARAAQEAEEAARARILEEARIEEEKRAEAEAAAREKEEKEAAERARKQAQIDERRRRLAEKKAKRAEKKGKFPVVPVSVFAVAGLAGLFALPALLDKDDGEAPVSPKGDPPTTPETKAPYRFSTKSKGGAVTEPDKTFPPKPGSIGDSYTNSLGMEFVAIPGLDGVLFSKWETRVRDYAAYAEANPGVDSEWKDVEYEGNKQTSDHSVVNVSWEDAQAFCAWLREKEGKTYRLPTDHEWSVAVGIGDREDQGARPSDKSLKVSGVYPWGTEWPPPEGAGNYYDQSIEGFTDNHPFTAPVGSYTPNQFGLYDLGGNVWEWCEDWYDSDQSFRVLRGGSWNNNDQDNLLSSNRNNNDPTNRNNNDGFRCGPEDAGTLAGEKAHPAEGLVASSLRI